MKDRKKDHIEQAFHARMGSEGPDPRFNYEPLLSRHPVPESQPFSFLGKQMNSPIWISSMTGGTGHAGEINRTLARACKEFGLGMGLGSCRSLLENDDFFPDFDLRDIIGDSPPFYANLGIAQVEEMVLNDDVTPLEDLVNRLRADGLIIHVNPIQEWLQPEGNRFTQPPIDTIRSLLEMTGMKVIIKEVGQGMGPESLRSLMELPIEAVDLAAFGGTNFAKLEMMRSEEPSIQYYNPFSLVGHDAYEMTEMINSICEEESELQCNQVIISGGIRSFMDGYYLVNRCKVPAVYGQAWELLNLARKSYEELSRYLKAQVEGLQLAQAFLKVR
jgi:isopentenyl-diphosphate delta-isomerase